MHAITYVLSSSIKLVVIQKVFIIFQVNVVVGSELLTPACTMLRAVNWGEKLGHVFGGHHGRILRILLLFLCSLGVLVVIYRARTERINKENATAKYQQKRSAT